MTIWEPWMEITYGGVSREELLARFALPRTAQLTRDSYRIGGYALSMVMDEAFVISPTRRKIIIVRATLGARGFTEEPTITEILGAERLMRDGLEKIPAEAAPCIRLAYSGQPNGEGWEVGMDPILVDSDVVSDRYPNVFRVDCDSWRWLCNSDARPQRRWGLKDEWLWAVSNKPTSDGSPA